LFYKEQQDKEDDGEWERKATSKKHDDDDDDDNGDDKSEHATNSISSNRVNIATPEGKCAVDSRDDKDQCSNLEFLRQAGRVGSDWFFPVDDNGDDALVMVPTADLSPASSAMRSPAQVTRDRKKGDDSTIFRNNSDQHQTTQKVSTGSILFQSSEHSDDEFDKISVTDDCDKLETKEGPPVVDLEAPAPPPPMSLKHKVFASIKVPSIRKKVTQSNRALYKWAAERNLNPENFDTVRKIDRAAFRVFVVMYTSFVVLIVVSIPFWTDDYQVIH
jgi:hypothetical protein